MSSLFQRRDIEQYADSLADYFPNGRLFISKRANDSNFRKLLRGIAYTLFDANGLLIEYDILPDETEKFLSEWESALGIPDDCFSGTGTNNERRRDILVKLASLGIQTAQDFVDLAALFGLTVVVKGGITENSFPLTFPFIFFDTDKEARFTIVIEFFVQGSSVFPFTFPFVFGSNEQAILECLFQKLKPANCNLIFKQVT